MSKCPCGSKKQYDKCCEPYISGKESAPTAESLMRARYSAFEKGEINFIRDSYAPEKRGDFDENATKEWSLKSRWLGLEILSTEAGMENDEVGKVEFVAKYVSGNEEQRHHEVAEFRKDKKTNTWFFLDGKSPRNEPVVRGAPKVGRNDHCPCGSGKKFKKCCG